MDFFGQSKFGVVYEYVCRTVLGANANRFLKKYTGHSWQELIVIAKTNVLTK